MFAGHGDFPKSPFWLHFAPWTRAFSILNRCLLPRGTFIVIAPSGASQGRMAMDKIQKRSGKPCLWISLVAGTLLFCFAGGVKVSEAGTARITVDLTNQKNGCLDCHVGKTTTPDGKQKDISLAGETKTIPRHPAVPPKSTFKDCVSCHNQGAEKIMFVNRLHEVHLNSEIYAGKFRQSCAGCHNMKVIKGK